MKVRFTYRLHQQPDSQNSNLTGAARSVFQKQVIYTCTSVELPRTYALKMQHSLNTTMVVRDHDRLTTRKLKWKCFTNHTYLRQL